MKAIRNKVIVRHYFGGERKTESGLIMPGTKSGVIGKFQIGQVVSIGKDVDPEINVFDYVFYEYGACTDVDSEGKLSVINSEGIQGIVDMDIENETR